MSTSEPRHPEEPSPTSARDRILRAAARLYALRGYEGTSMREIAEAAGVTKPLIYYHFASKERLYSTLLREATDACRSAGAEILARPAGAAQKMRELLRGHVTQARKNPEVFAFAQEVLTMPGLLPLGYDYKTEGREIFEDLVRLIEDGQRKGEFRPVDPRAAATIPLGALSICISAVLSGDLDQLPAGLDETLFDLLMHGLEVRDR